MGGIGGVFMGAGEFDAVPCEGAPGRGVAGRGVTGAGVGGIGGAGVAGLAVTTSGMGEAALLRAEDATAGILGNESLR